MWPEFISLKYNHFQIQIKIYIKLDSVRGAQNGGNRTYTLEYRDELYKHIWIEHKERPDSSIWRSQKLTSIRDSTHTFNQAALIYYGRLYYKKNVWALDNPSVPSKEMSEKLKSIELIRHTSLI